eukprot:PhM_4_TR15947/c0_g3_i6/m.50116
MRSVGILRGADYAMCCLTHSDNAAHPCHVVCGASNVVAHLKTNHSTDERVKNLLASTSGLKSDLTLDELNGTVGGSGLFKHPTVDDILHKGTVFWQRFEADGLPRTYPSITRDCAIALYLYTASGASVVLMLTRRWSPPLMPSSRRTLTRSSS